VIKELQDLQSIIIMKEGTSKAVGDCTYVRVPGGLMVSSKGAGSYFVSTDILITDTTKRLAEVNKIRHDASLDDKKKTRQEETAKRSKKDKEAQKLREKLAELSKD